MCQFFTLQLFSSVACGYHMGKGVKCLNVTVASQVIKQVISWLTYFTSKNNCTIKRCSLWSVSSLTDRLAISCKPSCLAGVGWLGWGPSNSLQHISEQSLLCLILLALLHADPPTIFLSYDYFIILNSLCCIAVASYPLEQSSTLAIQYIHTTVIWMTLRCGSVLVPRLDSARPLVPSVPSCTVCEGPVDAKTIGISLEQPEGRCPELLAANDVHLLWQNQSGGWKQAGGPAGNSCTYSIAASMFKLHKIHLSLFAIIISCFI